jgi:hypothetical protein
MLLSVFSTFQRRSLAFLLPPAEQHINGNPIEDNVGCAFLETNQRSRSRVDGDGDVEASLIKYPESIFHDLDSVRGRLSHSRP